MTYQFQWVPMLQNAQGWYAKGIFGSHELPGKADDWLKDAGDEIPALLKRGQELGFSFSNGRRPTPNRQGRTATTLEWARRLTTKDVAVLKQSGVPYELLDRDGCVRAEPALAFVKEKVAGGLRHPNA